MRKTVLLFILCFCAATGFAQTIEQLAEAVRQSTKRDDLDTISHVVVADFDKDGISDIAAVFTRSPRYDERHEDTAAYSNRWLAIGLGKPDRKGVKLSFCTDVIQCPVCGGDMNDPLVKFAWVEEQQVRQDAVPAHFILEYESGSIDRLNLTYTVQFYQGDWVVVEMGQKNFNLMNLYSDFFRVNYLTRRSVRGGTPPLIPDQDGKPLTEKPMFDHTIEYFSFFPKAVEEGPRLDGMADDAVWQKAQPVDVHDDQMILGDGREKWKNNADLSFEARMLWEADSLYLLVRVNDDVLVPVGKDPKQMLMADHLELWFDFINYDIDYSGAYPALRDKPGISTAQLAVGFREGGEIVASVWYPESGYEAEGLKGKASRLEEGNGYIVELAIPKTLWMKLDRRKDPREKSFLDANSRFTLVVSDNDDPNYRKAEVQMATSKLVPGSPCTMGVLLPVEEFNLLRLEDMREIH